MKYVYRSGFVAGRPGSVCLRWHRELRALEPTEARWLDDELDGLLKEGEG
jgi:hypothetical protein